MIQFRVRYGQLRAEIDRGRRRLAAARALGLALCVPLTALALRWAGGIAFQGKWVAGASGLVLAATAAYGIARRKADEARALDRRFGLDELLVTAVEVDARGPRTPLESRLLEDAASRLTRIRTSETSEPERFRIELETAAALALILAGATILTDSRRAPALPAALDAPRAADGGRWRDHPSAAGDSRVPGAAERAMAGALRDQAMAQPLVGALAGGDLEAAAMALRTLSDQTRQLSPAGRRDMAAALEAASKALAPLDPALSDASARAADGLRAATPPADAQALRSLADVLASQVERRPRSGTAAPPAGTQASRLTAGATPRPIASSRPGAVGAMPSGSGAPAADRLVEPAPVRGGAGSGSPSAAAGSGTVPLSERETVRRYFELRGLGTDVEAAR